MMPVVYGLLSLVVWSIYLGYRIRKDAAGFASCLSIIKSMRCPSASRHCGWLKPASRAANYSCAPRLTNTKKAPAGALRQLPQRNFLSFLMPIRPRRLPRPYNDLNQGEAPRGRTQMGGAGFNAETFPFKVAETENSPRYKKHAVQPPDIRCRGGRENSHTAAREAIRRLPTTADG